MPNDRLDALRRQRTLVAQHLAWLDAEIAAADGAAGPAREDEPQPVAPEAAAPVIARRPPALPPQPPKNAGPATPASSDEEKLAVANARANAILEEYAVTDRFDPAATRRGCLLFAVAVFLFGVAGLLAIYFFRYR